MNKPTEKQIEAATAAIDALAYQHLPDNMIYRAIAEAALTAALAVEAGTGPEADVEALYFTDRTLPMLAISGEAECNNVIRLHYRRPVSNADRDSVIEALNAALTTSPASSGVEGEAVAVPPLKRYPHLKPREFLLFASYCGDDNDACSPRRPCAECLAMSNIYDENGKYLREFGAPSLSAGAGGEE